MNTTKPEHHTHQHYQASSDSLKDKIILVTGASDGIGRVAAIHFALHGATVILHGRDLEKLELVYDEIVAFNAPTPAIVPLNLSTALEYDYELMADAIERQFGRLDGILHNAGILGERVALQHYNWATWQEVMTVNVQAPVFLTQTLLPLFKKSSSASVIFTSSGVGRAVREHWGAYSISKIALEAVSQLFNLENDAQHIRYNCVNPGATRTTMRAKAFPDENPLDLVSAEQIMPTYLYLMSDDSVDVRGQSLDAQ